MASLRPFKFVPSAYVFQVKYWHIVSKNKASSDILTVPAKSSKCYLLGKWQNLISSVGTTSDCRFNCSKFKSQLGHIAFMAIDYEIIFMVIPSLWLIQEGQLLMVTGRDMCTCTCKPLRELSLPRKSVNRSADQLNMTLTVSTGPLNSNSCLFHYSLIIIFVYGCRFLPSCMHCRIYIRISNLREGLTAFDDSQVVGGWVDGVHSYWNF